VKVADEPDHDSAEQCAADLPVPAGDTGNNKSR
jgi:hypothetical protein